MFLNWHQKNLQKTVCNEELKSEQGSKSISKLTLNLNLDAEEQDKSGIYDGIKRDRKPFALFPTEISVIQL